MSVQLPTLSGRFAWWFTSWSRGYANPDDLTNHVVADDVAHDVAGLPGVDGTLPLLLALPHLRRLADSAGLALPTPGALTGLGGPAPFNRAATEIGEAVVLAGGAGGLVPYRAGPGVMWQLLPAHRRQLTDLGEASRQLRATLSQCATALADLDVARWRPEVADELMNLRHRTTFIAPGGTPTDAVDLAGRAWQAESIVELALIDEGGAVSAQEIAHRQSTLTPLAQAARTALVAACSPEVWPPVSVAAW
ncbi:hypothetical protein ACLM5J_11955 [Nocardioides sp. Bht2]|uniref:hypothetical protein n=1 Tax=Nocardioides sp. Bht2 TaxID=3392297 RepID=UPI0039B67E6C